MKRWSEFPQHLRRFYYRVKVWAWKRRIPFCEFDRAFFNFKAVLLVIRAALWATERALWWPFKKIRANVWRLKLWVIFLAGNLWRIRLLGWKLRRPVFFIQGNIWRVRIAVLRPLVLVKSNLWRFRVMAWMVWRVLLLVRGNLWRVRVLRFKLERPFIFIKANSWRVLLLFAILQNPVAWFRGYFPQTHRLLSTSLNKIYFFAKFQIRTRLLRSGPRVSDKGV